MKKLYFIFTFFVFCGISIFGNNDKQEEVDFLLFSPNSSNRFVNEEQAFIQLNNLAQYLSKKNLIPGQIIVCGYAAYAPNNIKSADLSRERALFVMDELQKRGISKDLFSDPVGYGSVYLWGNNANENDKKLNRRVRILLNAETPMPITQEIINAEIETRKVENVNTFIEAPVAPKAAPKAAPKKSSFKFPWWILPVLALLLLVFLLLKEQFRKPVHKGGTINSKPQITETDTVPEPEPAPAETAAAWMVNLDDEIRSRAYELSQQHNDPGDYREQDWYNAVHEISVWYTVCGHSVFNDGGCWWASRAYSY